ncbi:MAG: putative membrane protein, partial [Pseudoalteromonas tetraodonis]
MPDNLVWAAHSTNNENNMEPLIPASNAMAILGVLLGLVGIGMWMETKAKLAQWGTISIILLGALVSALGIIPRSAPVYGTVVTYFVPVSIALLLFKADLRRIWKESGKVFVAFIAAAIATVIGGLLGMLAADLGDQEGAWVSTLISGFIGGSANTTAVADSLGLLTSPDMGTAVAAVYAVAVPFLALILAMPQMAKVWHWFSPIDDSSAFGDVSEEQANQYATPITGLSLILSVSLAVIIAAVSTWCSVWLDYPPAKYLMITTLAVGFATLSPKAADQLNGHYELGQLFIYLFFAVIGASINFSLALENGLQVMIFCVVLLTVHMVLMAIAGRILKLNGPELLVATNACILGPPTAAAMAVSKGWHNLTTPAVLCGVFGYATANYI